MTADTSHFTLRRIEVANFKRFAQAEFELRPLTLPAVEREWQEYAGEALLLGMRGLYARYEPLHCAEPAGLRFGQAEDVFTLGKPNQIASR